jgi:hypothetical protein
VHQRGWAAGVQSLQKPQKRNLKKTDFVDIISKILHDLSSSLNQPQKSNDDWYIRILKNKLIKFKKQDDRTP